MHAWTNDEPIELICTDKWQETPDTVSFALACPTGKKRFHFKPGQFCSLGFELDHSSTEYRAYSISSLPEQDDIRFTVKRVAGGRVSNHIVDHLQVGHRVKALKPAGLFNNIDCLPQAKVTMISAGCGITPVMSMVKHWLADNQNVTIDFIHMARSKAETIYFAELERLAKIHDNFHLKLLLKNNDGTDYAQGRLDQEWLVKLSPDITERSVYLCGPVAFMQEMKSHLQALDFNMAHFFAESFSPTPPVASAESAEPAEPAGQVQVAEKQATSKVKILVPDFAVEQEAEADSLLIDALEQGGLPVIAACRSGVCGSCRVKVNQGEVVTSSTETLTEDDINQGYVLACSCKVKSNVGISLN